MLILGVGYDTNTSLHLAEWRQPEAPRQVTGSSIRQPDRSSHWVTRTDVAENEADFEAIDPAFEAAQ